MSKELDVVDAANDSPSGTAGAATPVTDQQIFDQVSAVACDTDRLTLETAIEAFVAMEGRPPTDEAELVGTFLRAESPSFDVAPDGTLIPAPGSTCT